ncbi:unnamed protein product [Schistocephalus solidus]|uniref:Wsv001 n=1 Tax=Schistocephalus solidus TaxID=70667 RepID=A0A183TCR5_SCHSO|nr:unnamed protein product [Schistocephalus solidus]
MILTVQMDFSAAWTPIIPTFDKTSTERIVSGHHLLSGCLLAFPVFRFVSTFGIVLETLGVLSSSLRANGHFHLCASSPSFSSFSSSSSSISSSFSSSASSSSYSSSSFFFSFFLSSSFSSSSSSSSSCAGVR